MSYKAQAISREVADRLAKRFDTLTVVESTGSAGDPLITISDGTPAAGEKVIVIRTVSDETGVAKDVLGNDAIHYTPHKVQICTEANPTAGAGADILAAQDLLNALAEVAMFHPSIEWYQSANTDVPQESEIVAGNLAATWTDLYWSRKKSS